MMYRIEFDGRLLEGFDLQFVRMEVAVRLRLRDTQVDRLFSGQTVVLKKAVDEANSKVYMNELRTIGLDARLVPIDAPDGDKASNFEYKVVFWGKILPGFDRATVMASVAKRLKIPPSLLLQVFSGAKVVLKRSVSPEQGAKLVVDLALLGMQIELEQDAPAATVALQPTPPGVPTLPAAGLQEADPQYGALLRTACDLSGNALAAYDNSSVVARDDDDASLPQPKIEPPRTVKVGFSSANTDGYLNCPHCGFYQPYAATCGKCGAQLPKPATYVGRAAPTFGSEPTILVMPAEPAVVAKPAESPRSRKPAESLYDLKQQQDDDTESHEETAFPIFKLAIALLVLGGVILLLLSR